MNSFTVHCPIFNRSFSLVIPKLSLFLILWIRTKPRTCPLKSCKELGLTNCLCIVNTLKNPQRIQWHHTSVFKTLLCVLSGVQRTYTTSEDRRVQWRSCDDLTNLPVCEIEGRLPPFFWCRLLQAVSSVS